MFTCPLAGCEITVSGLSSLNLHLLFSSSERLVYAPMNSKVTFKQNEFTFTSQSTVFTLTMNCDSVRLVPDESEVQQQQAVAKISNSGSVAQISISNTLSFFVLNGTRADSNTFLDKKFTKIVVTVPHAVDPQGAKCQSRNICDSMATTFAAIVVDGLKLRNIPHAFLIGDINRSILDLNRSESRNTEFRRRLRKEINEHVFVLDVHSYPKDEKWDNQPDINSVLLIDDPGHAFLIQHFIQSRILIGIKNDIEDEVHERKGGAALLEVNEGSSTAFLNKLAQGFWNFASNVIKM